MISNRNGLCAAILSFLFLASCQSEKAPAGPVSIKGAGATAPNIAYTLWAESFNKSNPEVKLEYSAVGSGEGLKQLEAKTVDFAASDIPLDDAEVARLGNPLHFPALIESIVPVYNVSGAKEIQFTGEALAGIYSGKIKTWNDPALKAANPGVALPASSIAVVLRSDPSGSTYALTDYLSKVSKSFTKQATLKVPGALDAKGSSGVAELVEKTPNSIGYIDLNYAMKSKLAYGAVKNAAGKFQKASIESQGGALEAAEQMTKDFRGSIANAPGEKSYPICTLTWLIVPHEISDPAKGRMLKRFLRWVYTDGQKLAMPLDYGILQPPLLERLVDQVETIKVPK